MVAVDHSMPPAPRSSDRPVLVLVHAFPMGAAMWRPQLPVLSEWRVVTASLPGFDGRPLLRERTMDTYARDLLTMLDGLGIGRAVFGGLSMGGFVLFSVLRQAPERVAGLLLANTRTSADGPVRRAARQRSIVTARTLGAAAIADDMLPNILGATTRATRPAVVADVRRLIEAQPAESIAAGLEAMLDRPDSLADLQRVDVPATIVVGDEDRVTPISDAEIMRGALRNAVLVTIPRAGHMANLEAPDAFNAALLALLARVPGESMARQ